jgi:hypothetical protein
MFEEYVSDLNRSQKPLEYFPHNHTSGAFLSVSPAAAKRNKTVKKIGIVHCNMVGGCDLAQKEHPSL